MTIGIIFLASAVALTSRPLLPPPPPQKEEPDWSKFPGALIKVSTKSTVGVLLDEIPQKQRERLVQSLINKPEEFWRNQAKKQIRFTSLRRNFGVKWPEKQVPLPPEQLWNVDLSNTPLRETIEGHDLVTVNYAFESIILTDANSPEKSRPELKEVGGIWKDSLLLPLDPDFVFQRTGFACINESQNPPNSFDTEEADFFYDQKCRVEKKLSSLGCHQTKMPSQSCAEAVSDHIGKHETFMTFERLPWDAAVADQVRIADITNRSGPDLKPLLERFSEHRLTYRYIPQNSCTLVERCVSAPGWRRLLMFPTGDINSGTEPLDIGRVDYFHEEGGSVLSERGVFEYSACHNHYHFSHYGSLSLGEGAEAINRKNGFCLQPTARLSNHELSPMNHEYVDCVNQGVSPGWIDEYIMGLECQWLDVSEVKPNQNLTLAFTSNPDGLMCEGKLKVDAQGKQLFEPTEFKTSIGGSVYRQQCDFHPDWATNNTLSYEVHIPEKGESYITESCKDDVFGPLRNCDLKEKNELQKCEPGKKVNLRCSISRDDSSQVLRICEASRAMQIGIPCTYNEAIASEIIVSKKDISFTCPKARDAVETGGLYSFLTGPLFLGEKIAAVNCVVVD